MKNLKKVFTDPRQFQIFVLGIYSGMPLGVLYTSIPLWLGRSGVDVSVVTTFAIAGVFYPIKVFWAPFLDQIKIPILGKIGHRKSWILIISILISCVFYVYSFVEPTNSSSKLYYVTIMLGFLSASFDIVIDAFRVDITDSDQQAMASANAASGYLFGMKIAIGVIMLYIADEFDWSKSFLVLGALYLALGLFLLFFVKEPNKKIEDFKILTIHSWKVMVVDPFIDFFKRDYSVMILLAIIFYKMGDAFLGVVANPFYVEMEFTNKELIATTKIFGTLTMLLGSYLGGVMIYKLGHFKGLIVGGIAQSVTNLSFVWLYHMGHDIIAITVTIAIENIAAGVGTAALIGYLGYLCNKRFSATQYALLSSASGLFRNTLASFGGSMVNFMGWDLYFIMTVFMAIPGLLILSYLNKKIKE